MGLTGPSRRINVKPKQRPAVAPPPRREPERQPERAPAPAREKVPAGV